MTFLPNVIEKTKNYYGFEPLGIILPAIANSQGCWSKQVIALAEDKDEALIWTASDSSVRIFIGQGCIPQYEVMKAVKLYIAQGIVGRFPKEPEFGIYAELKEKMDYPVDWKKENFDYWVSRSKELVETLA